MAGESPDRSKQRESSAEPTPGSAAPVPEARGEHSGDSAAGGHDPRQALARGASGGGVDTATRVLSVRDLAEAGQSAADGDAGADGENVSADEDTPEDENPGEGASGGRAAERATSDPEGDAADAEGDDTEATADADGGDPRAVGEGPEAGESAPEAGDDAVDDAEGTEGDARLRKAVAAWVRSADGEEGAQKAASADAQAPQKAAEGEESASRTAEPADAPTDATDASEGAEDTPGAETDAAAHAEADADRADAEAEAEAETDAAAEPAVEDATPEDSPATPEDSPTEPKAADEPKATPAGKQPDQPTTMLKLGDLARARGGKGAVDQPTTMLKLGDTRPKPTADAKDAKAPKDAEADAEPQPAKAKDAESEAERTSKFVALKPLDDPSTRRPARPGQPPQPPAAEATTALRKITPDAKPAAPGTTGTPGTPGAPAKPAADARPAPAEATAAIPQVGPERTTQQPLPPKPPLDLLAELTNTPPPPQTPLRTAVRRVKIWTPLVILLVIVFAIVQAVRPLPTPTLDLTAEDTYTFDGGKVDIPWPASGQAALDVQGIGTFGSSGDQKPVPIASVAKVMTAYLILRGHPLKSGEDGPKIPIDKTAEAQSSAGQESTVHVTAGDSITEREALESILIASANNVARLLARWDSGSEQAFVAKMNAAAKDLGMTHTTYTDPSGLNNTTVSTAVDQVKLAKQAMDQPAFREVAAMMKYVDYKGVPHDNWNRLVGHNHVVGIKTGTTTSALGNLVFAAKKDVNGVTHRIVGAVVRQPAGGPDNTILGAALYGGDQLIRAAQAALEAKTILKKGDVVGYADDGVGGRTPVVVTQDVTAVGWAGLKVRLSFAPDELPHTAKAGTKVGTLTVGDGSNGAVKVPVALQKDLTEPGFADKLTRLG